MSIEFINVQQEILISKSATELYAFISNLENDQYWRTEVKKTILLSEKQTASFQYEQHSYLSARMPNCILIWNCVSEKQEFEIVYETDRNGDYSQQTIRRVKATSFNESVFNYTLTFDPIIVKHALGFSLPNWLVYWYTQFVMKKYLKNLKKWLECKH